MSLIPKSECIPTFEFKTTFTRPSPDGEPPDVRILSHDNGSFTVKKGEPSTTPVSKRPKSKPKLSKQELLEFFDRFFQKLEGQIEGAKKQAEIQAGECLLIEPVSNALKWCLQDLKLYINTYGGE